MKLEGLPTRPDFRHRELAPIVPCTPGVRSQPAARAAHGAHSRRRARVGSGCSAKAQRRVGEVQTVPSTVSSGAVG